MPASKKPRSRTPTRRRPTPPEKPFVQPDTPEVALEDQPEHNRYEIRTTCMNCGKQIGGLWVPKGTPMAEVRCEECGARLAKRFMVRIVWAGENGRSAQSRRWETTDVSEEAQQAYIRSVSDEFPHDVIITLHEEPEPDPAPRLVPAISTPEEGSDGQEASAPTETEADAGS